MGSVLVARAPLRAGPVWLHCMALRLVASSSGLHIPFSGCPLSPRFLSLRCGLVLASAPVRLPFCLLGGGTLPLSSLLPCLPCPLSAAWCSLGIDRSLWGVGTAPPVSGVGGEGPGDLDSPSERPRSEIIGTGVDLLDPKPFSAGGQRRGLGFLTCHLRLSVLICHVRQQWGHLTGIREDGLLCGPPPTPGTWACFSPP